MRCTPYTPQFRCPVGSTGSHDLRDICNVSTGECSASTGAGGTIYDGRTWASKEDVGGLFDDYTPGIPQDHDSGESIGAYYFKWANPAPIFADFIPSIDYSDPPGDGAYYITHLDAMTRDAEDFRGSTFPLYGILTDDYDYTYIAIDSNRGTGHSYLNWVYEDVAAVPIPAPAFMFAPALLGFMSLRRRAKNKA